MKENTPFFPCFGRILALAAAVLCGCTLPALEPAGRISVDRWEPETFQQQVGRCDAQPPDCVRVKLVYPAATAGQKMPVDDAVYRFVERHLLASVVSETPAPDPETLAAQFVYAYEKLKNELKGYRSLWYVNREVAVIYASGRVVSLRFAEETYTGGAHPNARRLYRSFDAATGRPIDLKDLVPPEKLPRLEAAAGKRFRRMHGIPPGVSLEQAGFWFDGGRFRLNDNFARVADGLVFYYNAYEIAAYAKGPSELEIPWAEVRRLVDDRWID